MMDDLTPVEAAVLAYLIKEINAGRAPVMADIAEQFHWLSSETLRSILNTSLYGKGYIDFRLDETPSLVILKNPFVQKV